MNRLERIGLGTGLIVLLLSLQFISGLLGEVAAYIASVLLGAAITFAWIRFQLPHQRRWLLPTIIAVCDVSIFLIAKLGFHADTLLILTAVLGASSSLATQFASHWDSVRCGLCNRRLRTQAVVFQCPRCRLRVCEETCWNFEHRRCNLCLEQRVPVLPIQDRWWLRVTGPRYDQGRCQVCLAAASQVDLRSCPHCRRPQCRDCWDFRNAECARCGGTLPDLPPSLTMTVAEIAREP